MNSYSKWVACWGNGISITEQKEAMYAKDITLRYPIKMCFSGDALRLHFNNFTGSETVVLTKVFVDKNQVLFNGKEECVIEPGKCVVSDELRMDIVAGETVDVDIYLEDFTQMNAGVLITGPLSKGFYAYGDFSGGMELDMDRTRNTNWFYFLDTIDIHTAEKNHAIICYGDSITAQSWPDYLAIRAWEEGYRDISIIRRAVSGTRILRQYDCITYAAYGLKGAIRFPIEADTAGATDVIIQHGINDIIHPVGVEVNQFRPWSDMPTAQDLIEGVKEIYIKKARELGLKVWSATLLPIFGWRTYTDFRDEVRNEYNEWLREYEEFEGCIDFDMAVRDENKPEAFKDGFDSGDHLHPSEEAYKAMANTVLLGTRSLGTK